MQCVSQQVRLAATYVGMFMWDSEGCCNGGLVCAHCLPSCSWIVCVWKPGSRSFVLQLATIKDECHRVALITPSPFSGSWAAHCRAQRDMGGEDEAYPSHPEREGVCSRRAWHRHTPPTGREDSWSIQPSTGMYYIICFNNLIYNTVKKNNIYIYI